MNLKILCVTQMKNERPCCLKLLKSSKTGTLKKTYLEQPRGHNVPSLYFPLQIGDDLKQQLYSVSVEAKAHINNINALKITL